MALTATLADAAYRYSGGETVNSVPIGTASADRVVFCWVGANNWAGVTVTIGGISAAFAEIASGLGWAMALVPTGTTANVVVTGGVDVQVFGCFAITGGADTTPHASLLDASGDGSEGIAVLAGGSIIGAGLDGAGPGTPMSWSAGITNQGAAFDITGGANSCRLGAADFASAGTITCTVGGGGFNVPMLASIKMLPARTGTIAATEGADSAAMSGNVISNTKAMPVFRRRTRFFPRKEAA